MPHPKNYETAQSVESILRSKQITPATIALIGGKIHIGLTDSILASISDPSFSSVKVSRRDLAPVLSLDGNGGTTVAGTMYIAQSVGIPLFVTGGIGGVHRGAESSTSCLPYLFGKEEQRADGRYGRFGRFDRIGKNGHGSHLCRSEKYPGYTKDT